MTTSAIPANSPAGTGGIPLAGATGPAPDAPAPAGPPALVDRLNALDRLVEAGYGRLEQPVLDDAGALLDRAGQRLRLSGDHTVVTLAGGTGSGKSSLFNAICGLELSPTGMRRPMTSKAHSCVWGLDGAGPLLDWLDVDKRHRYARASALDLERADAGLQGLVLIDLPDHDSIQAVHRAEVDRFVTIADLLVWVVDPQKYADAALHRNYIVPFARHTGVTLIVLNQVDRLAPHEIDDCVADLRRLLEAEGLADPRIVTTSAVAPDGVHGFRDVLIDTVAARRARTERLSADVDRVAERFTAYRFDAEPPTTVDEGRRNELIQAFTDAAGAPAVAEAMESAYELRAADFVGWPVSAMIARLRSDPLRRMRLTELREELRNAFTGPVGAQQGDVDNALQGVTEGITPQLPTHWGRSVRAAARARATEIPEALGESLKAALPTFNTVPRWWWLVKTWQYFLILVAVLSVVWIGFLVAYGLLGAGGDDPSGLIGQAGLIPYVAVLVVCTLGMGWLTASACRNLVALSSAKHGEKMEHHMRQGIEAVAFEKVIEPIEDDLEVYARFRKDVDVALG
ncbi:Predicted GTPase [Actinomadura meyerae]|uniref:Predicted GTPase n=1 Tax=Actinomadura meyerae TaxID=240840 RepID=A0A239NSW5_9ACTN|nr:ABC transporter [Actinomadura meyerae]SNT57840.1 Predicted GTPase [Actinomadura meyerae]